MRQYRWKDAVQCRTVPFTVTSEIAPVRETRDFLRREARHARQPSEQNVRAKPSQHHTVEQVCAYIAIDAYAAAHCAFRKVSPARLRDSIANYDEIAEALAGSAYARYL